MFRLGATKPPAVSTLGWFGWAFVHSSSTYGLSPERGHQRPCLCDFLARTLGVTQSIGKKLNTLVDVSVVLYCFIFSQNKYHSIEQRQPNVRFGAV